MKKKIALVLTGGTIGSETHAKTIDLPLHGHLALLQRYQTLYPADTAAFDVFSPIQILSENMTGHTLYALMKFLTDLDKTAYSGIVITHGSDTLHFTAAMAALLFFHTSIPIVFTCSIQPPDHPKTNAFINLHIATEAIEQQIRGVWLAYQNFDGKPFLLDAARISPCTQSGEFYDYYGAAAFQYQDGRFLKNANYLPKQSPYAPCTLPLTFQNVLYISPYPLLNYSAIPLHTFDCVLHSGYHSATACCAGENTSILPFISRCHQHNKPFYFVLPDQLEKPYGTTAQILESPVIPIYGLTPYAAYTYLLLQNA